MNQIVRYDAMIYAIGECHKIDEVKDLRDKAMALELYAKQARNTDAERKASEVRLRAERRTGELLKELARATPVEAGSQGGNAKAANTLPESVALPTMRSATPSPYSKALQQTGISTQAASRYQALANVPAPVFEEALRDPVVKPVRQPGGKATAGGHRRLDLLQNMMLLEIVSRRGSYSRRACEPVAPLKQEHQISR